MDHIRKYSREWFAEYKGKYTDKLDKKDIKRVFSKEFEIKKELFTGNSDEVAQKINAEFSDFDVKNLDMEKLEQLNLIDDEQSTIFKLLDVNCDGEVTKDEINSVAALDTEELAKVNDENLSSKDLAILYKNALNSKGATISSYENKKVYEYKNGDKTYIELNPENPEEILSKDMTEKTSFAQYQTIYDYINSSKTEIVYDNKGLPRELSYENGDKKTEKRMIIQYKDDTVKNIISTIGQTYITENKKDTNKIISEKRILNYSSNREIEDTKQKNIGDCWILADVNSLKATEKGREVIKNSIIHNDNGSVTVKLNGVNREYTYSAEDIVALEYPTKDKTYALGDTDMNLIEMAIKDYRIELFEKDPYRQNETKNFIFASKEDPINGGVSGEATYYLTGLKKEVVEDEECAKILNRAKTTPERFLMQVSFKTSHPEITDGKIISSHAYSIEKITEDTIYITNPWDSSKTIPYEKNKFLNDIGTLTYVDMNKLKTTF